MASHDSSEEGDDLSDGLIRVLLLRAEQRLSKTPAKKQVRQFPTLQRIPKLESGGLARPYIASVGGVARADPSRLLSGKERRLANTVRRVEDPVKLKERITKEEQATAGPDCFDMPRTNLTPELKADMQLLKMRSILDPHRHYKRESSKTSLPKYSQVGTIIESPTEYFSSRLPNKERKRTIVEEVLANERSTGHFKSKYNEIQVSKTSGRKAFYKKLKKKRSGAIRKP